MKKAPTGLAALTDKLERWRREDAAILRAQGVRQKGGRKRGRWNISRHNFRAWRESHNLSRIALGKMLGVSGTAIGNWEDGTSVPLPKHQFIISAAMKGDHKPSSMPAETDPLEVASMQLGIAIGRFLAVFSSLMLGRGST